MMIDNFNAKSAAAKVCRRFKISSAVTYKEIEKVINGYMYEIIPFNLTGPEDDNVQVLINRLGLQDEIKQHNAFVFTRGNLRFVFLNSMLSDDEKCAVLLHELGHICDPSFQEPEAIYSSVMREEFADEFAFHIKHQSIITRIGSLKKSVKIAIAAILTASLCTYGIFAYYGKVKADSRLYYVTVSGKRYHKEKCQFVKNKNNLKCYTKKEAEDKGYSPCHFCILD